MSIYADGKWHPVPAVRRTFSAEELLHACAKIPREFIAPANTIISALETLKKEIPGQPIQTQEMERAIRTLKRMTELETKAQEALSGIQSHAHRIEAIQGFVMLHASYYKVTQHLSESFRGLMLDINARKTSMPPDERDACDHFLAVCPSSIEAINGTMQKFNEKFRDLGIQPTGKGR